MARTSRIVWAVAAAVVLSSGAGCTIVKVYEGSKLRANPAGIVTGRTTMAEVLADFGAPNRIQRRADGDVFVYTYVRRNSTEISIEEPVITNTEFLNYQKIEEKSDRLIVLFDADGVVKARGFAYGTRELDGDEKDED